VFAFLSIPALRSIISIVVATLPNSIYMGKNVTIGVNISNSFIDLQVPYLTGKSVDIAGIGAIFNITKNKIPTL